jgi:hypothetical protein
MRRSSVIYEAKSVSFREHSSEPDITVRVEHDQEWVIAEIKAMPRRLSRQDCLEVAELFAWAGKQLEFWGGVHTDE